MHESQPLGIDLIGEKVESCRVAARVREARYQAHCQRVLADTKHNWNRVGRSFGRERSRGIARRCPRTPAGARNPSQEAPIRLKYNAPLPSALICPGEDRAPGQPAKDRARTLQKS